MYSSAFLRLQYSRIRHRELLAWRHLRTSSLAPCAVGEMVRAPRLCPWDHEGARASLRLARRSGPAERVPRKKLLQTMSVQGPEVSLFPPLQAPRLGNAKQEPRRRGREGRLALGAAGGESEPIAPSRR